MAIEDEEERAWLALAWVACAGTGRWLRLADALGGARALFAASDAQLTALDLAPRGRKRLRSVADWSKFDRRRESCARRSMAILTIGSCDYPPLLREIPDPPLVLYYYGAKPASLAPAVAVVGSRKASQYGRRVAGRIGGELAAAGVTVVSGLALGIDGAAHQGALGTGTTAAVMACGLDCVYPRSHRGLLSRIRENGSVMSEYPPGEAPLPRHFPVRNRIITGLSLATVVVEAGHRSGSLVSARLAADQGREVLAVPGNIDSAASAGTNDLIRQGCAPLLAPDDVFDALGMRPAAAPPGPGEQEENGLPDEDLGDPDMAAVLACLESEPRHIDTIIDTCALDGARVMELLTALELAGLAESRSGAAFVRAGGGFSACRP